MDAGIECIDRGYFMWIPVYEKQVASIQDGFAILLQFLCITKICFGNLFQAGFPKF
jgi:hypothetical protein